VTGAVFLAAHVPLQLVYQILGSRQLGFRVGLGFDVASLHVADVRLLGDIAHPHREIEIIAEGVIFVGIHIIVLVLVLVGILTGC